LNGMTAGSWEHIAIWWDEQVGEWGDYYHQHLILPALLRALGELTRLSVVDLGCGNGASSRWLARAGADVIGVEVSAAMVERARAWEERTPLGVEYLEYVVFSHRTLRKSLAGCRGLPGRRPLACALRESSSAP